ncbi:LysM peptidoglycan-binding domain-containing protein [Aeromicrobium sp.]|uniref:LysM peptidoglycan-binding domain-containing protein n=1 Tax=Aeromicrobium sp. TaxID=1871063 RepID=UPI003D6A0304
MSSILLGDVGTARHLHLVADLPRPAHLQLTRRGRLAVLVAALITLAVLVVALGSSTTATGDAGAPVATRSVTVEPGDTLWKVASQANPNGDIRQTVDDIMQLNSLPSAGGLQMGSEIAVPIYE